ASVLETWDEVPPLEGVEWAPVEQHHGRSAALVDVGHAPGFDRDLPLPPGELVQRRLVGLQCEHGPCSWTRGPLNVGVEAADQRDGGEGHAGKRSHAVFLLPCPC